MLKSKRIRLAAAAVSVVAAAGLGLGGLAPAASATGSHVIDGRGVATNDWGDEGTLSKYQHANSNATRLWQTVLYADGAKWKGSDGKWHKFTKWDIDGQFGWKTHSATKYWQDKEELEDVDGIVGKETFGHADDFLDGPYGGGKVIYMGLSHEVKLKRLDGKYYVKIDGQWKQAAYDWSS
ncbi:hypothetical protein P8605_15390 [Streptomyces sp. T-3]|nr:hypothetical protein [Streptomyces sp. T-3]